MATEKRLIDANALIKDIDNYYHNSPFTHPGTTWLRGLELAVGLVLKAPTVDAVEVVHGRWEWYADRCEDLFLGCDDDYGWRCSMCEVPLDDEDDPEVMPTFHYCPNCGAKMDGDGNGNL